MKKPYIIYSIIAIFILLLCCFAIIILYFLFPSPPENEKVVLPTIIPTATATLALPTPTKTPQTIPINNGDVGSRWSDESEAITLNRVYIIDMIDGKKPSGRNNGGFEHGYTHFLVMDITYEYLGTSGHRTPDPERFFLTAYNDNFVVDYRPDLYRRFSLDTKYEVYPNEKKTFTLIYEIKPIKQNFTLCDGMTGGISYDGVYSGCPDLGFPFTFKMDFIP